MKTDSLYLQQIYTNADYDYIRELGEKTENHALENVDMPATINLGDVINQIFHNELVRSLCIIIVALVIALMVYKLFRSINIEGGSEPKDMGGDTIYGHKWANEIDQAMNTAQYSEAIVLIYLRWLDKLNDEKTIHFDQSKTPGMYITEVSENAPEQEREHLLDVTRTLTHHYLRIRYGHRKGSEALANKLLAL